MGNARSDRACIAQRAALLKVVVRIIIALVVAQAGRAANEPAVCDPALVILGLARGLPLGNRRGWRATLLVSRNGSTLAERVMLVELLALHAVPQVASDRAVRGAEGN